MFTNASHGLRIVDCLYAIFLYIFFFKQKTAYEMRISDWSSDVCSSDLTVAGDHDVIFAGPEEMITLSHRAENRMIFARGAVRAALWQLNQKPDRYTMPQVLGLSEG